MDNNLEDNQEMQESRDLSNNMGNENFLDNMKLSKTEYIPNPRENVQNSPEENQKASINQINQSQNIFPGELAERKDLQSSNIQNDNNNGNNNLNENEDNHSLEKNESNQKIQEKHKSQFIESHHIYDQQPNMQKSEFIESHHIYESNPEQIDRNVISKQTDNNFESQKEFPSNPMIQNEIEEKKETEKIIDQIKHVENTFNSLKISKTKYLTDEELSDALKINNENVENKINDNKDEKQIQNAYPSDRLGQNENAFSTNYENNNIQTTNIETVGVDGNNARTNTLGKYQFMGLSKTQNIQDDNENANLNNNEVMQEPFKTKEIYSKPNTVRVLKIEDEEQVSICPDFISQLLRKIFG